MTRTDPRLADFQAVLFDMDGTLLDSTVAVESVWSAWAERNSIPTADVLAWCHGRNVAATITHFLPHIAPETLQSMVSAQLDQECTQLDSVKPAVGGRELLIWLDAHRIPWGVVTNAPRRLALARLGAAPSTHHSWSPSRTSSMASRRPTVTSMEPAPAVSRNPSVGRGGLCVRPAAARSAGTVVVAVGGRRDADVVCHDLVDLHRLLVQIRSK